MDKQELFDERVHLYKDTLNHRPVKRVASYLMLDALYAVQFQGKSLKEATYNPELLLNCTSEMLETVICDGVGNIYTKGGMFYRMTESKNFVQSQEGFLQHPEIYTLESNELTDLINDPFKTIAEKVLPRSLGKMDEGFPMNMYTMLKAYAANSSYLGKLGAGKMLVGKNAGVPLIYTNLTKAPLDYLGSSVRGLVGLFKDLRREKEAILEACDALLPLLTATGELSFRSPDRSFPFIFMPTLVPHFLKTKDFETFYFPTFKKLVEDLTDKGFNLVIQFEGNWERFYHCLQELPKNKIFGIFEFGNPKVAKEMLGDTMVVSGFYPLTLLGMGEPEACVNKAKEIIDILAPGGGYIFTTDKQITNIKDAKPENLKAVYQLIQDYGIY